VSKLFFSATLIGCAAAFAAASAPAAVPATNVGYRTADGARASGGTLCITGSQQADEIGVSLDSTRTQYVITSSHNTTAAPPCTAVSAYEVHCPVSEIAGFSASLLRGNDTFSISSSVRAPATLAGGTGLDLIRGGSGSETLIGGIHSDRLVGNKGQDTLLGGKGSDILNGGKGRDTLKGGKGEDVLRGGPGRDFEKQ
jgi:Ca2+-binding RTX toxin-like protein